MMNITRLLIARMEELREEGLLTIEQSAAVVIDEALKEITRFSMNFLNKRTEGYCLHHNTDKDMKDWEASRKELDEYWWQLPEEEVI